MWLKVQLPLFKVQLQESESIVIGLSTLTLPTEIWAWIKLAVGGTKGSPYALFLCTMRNQFFPMHISMHHGAFFPMHISMYNKKSAIKPNH